MHKNTMTDERIAEIRKRLAVDVFYGSTLHGPASEISNDEGRMLLTAISERDAEIESLRRADVSQTDRLLEINRILDCTTYASRMTQLADIREACKCNSWTSSVSDELDEALGVLKSKDAEIARLRTELMLAGKASKTRETNHA